MDDIFEDDPDFWTGDDDDESSSSCSEDARCQNDDEDATYATPSAIAEQSEDKQAARGPVDASYDGAEAEMAKKEQIPPPRKRIRKLWHVEDKSDVSDFDSMLPPDSRAMSWPFELDTFQKRAVLRVSKNNPVFVAAHTSAGKTVVAEYAIAQARARGLRAIYTSPIKALSNQKYRDFCDKFDSVGIITGDVRIKPEASCLIMTTEILRSMLYRGDEITNELDVVIFDEVHYVNDAERGVVWEEVIILMPPHVNMVFLSATVSNHKDFADWIGRTKQRTVYSVATLHRPTPLRHYLWFNDKKFLLLDEKHIFQTEALLSARLTIKKDTVPAAKAKGKAHAKPKPKSQGKMKSADMMLRTECHKLQALLQKLQQDASLPVIVFSFSRWKCQHYACAMPHLDLVPNSDDRARIHRFVRDSVKQLSEEDQQLPQIIIMSDLMSRGIGVHHGGLLPLVKEMVEILFQRGLVRVLFATETFAMGVNMPARSVVFTSMKKFDGRSARVLQAGEYTQMAGRAGRRGLDEFGQVIIFCPEELPDTQDLTKMTKSVSYPIRSQFRLTYAMLLQLAVSPCMRIEDMMAKSFSEDLRSRQLPMHVRDLKRRQKELEQIPAIDCLYGEPSIDSYHAIERALREVANELHFQLSQRSSKVLGPGRVVILHSLPFVAASCFASVLEAQSPSEPTKARFTCLVILPMGSTMPHMLSEFLRERQEREAVLESETREILLPKKPHGGAGVGSVRTCMPRSTTIIDAGTIEVPLHPSNEGGGSLSSYSKVHYCVCSGIPLSHINLISKLSFPREAEACANNNYSDARAVSKLAELVARERDGHERNGAGIPMLPLDNELKKLQFEFADSVVRQKDLRKAALSNKCHNCPKKEEHYVIEDRKYKCIRDIEELSQAVKEESLELMPTLYAKQDVLRQLGFITKDGAATLKGRLASLVLTADALPLGEVLVSDVLTPLEPEEMAAVLSAFVVPEKSDDLPADPTANIYNARNRVLEYVDVFSRAQTRCRVPGVNSGDEARMCNFALMEVAYEWARGTTFKKITEYTSLQEGSVVRCIARLDELLTKVEEAASAIGHTELKEKASLTREKIRRDIVFSVSLYLQ